MGQQQRSLLMDLMPAPPSPSVQSSLRCETNLLVAPAGHSDRPKPSKGAAVLPRARMSSSVRTTLLAAVTFSHSNAACLWAAEAGNQILLSDGCPRLEVISLISAQEALASPTSSRLAHTTCQRHPSTQPAHHQSTASSVTSPVPRASTPSRTQMTRSVVEV